MARTRIDYGIDLGTTNSAIARVDNGEVRIQKSDTQRDTVPSCVHFRKTTVVVGDRAFSRLSDESHSALKDFTVNGNTDFSFNTFVEFKRTMGTDKLYESESAGRSLTSEDLSAEVLKFLKTLVRDEEISSVVITVPNRFHNNQVDATQVAAELAGFAYCELLQEPIAASIAYGISTDNIEGYWLVFDFGGGTFDVALMKVEEGIMRVVDTDGDPHLGGKDLDYSIVDKIIVPHIRKKYSIDKILSDGYGKTELREALKSIAEEAKIAVSPPSKSSAPVVTYKPLGEDDDGEEIELDFEMKLSDFEAAVAPEFLRSIELSKDLIKRNSIKDTDLERIVLVGGPTLSQTLRKMVSEHFATTVDTSVDPMTAVAVGAALYASTRDVPISHQKRDTSKVQLTLKFPNTSVEIEETLGLRIDRGEAGGSVPEDLFVEIVRSDQGWSSNRIRIEGDAEIVEIHLREGKLNNFEVRLFDDKGNRLLCEPNSFSILQGLKPPEATLPYDICIEAFADGDQVPLLLDVGLKRNMTLPAKGKTILRTQKDIRPGNGDDKIRFPLFEGEVGTRAVHNLPVSTILGTGEDLGRFLPKGSVVNIDVEVDSSRRISFRAFFPDIDETIERSVERRPDTVADFSPEVLRRQLKQTIAMAETLEEEAGSSTLFDVGNINSDLSELSEMLEHDQAESHLLKIKERLRAVAKEIDALSIENEFPKAEAELLESLEDLKAKNERFGNDQASLEVLRLEKLANEVIRAENVPAIKDLIAQIDFMSFRLWKDGAGVAAEIGFIQHYDKEFDSITWTNPLQAKRLIDQGKEIVLSGEPTVEKLGPIVRDILRLLPEPERKKVTEVDDEYLTK